MSALYLPCATPGCGNTPGNLRSRIARAQFEYRLHHDSRYAFRLPCEKCKKTSKFSYEQIVGFLSAEKRPQPLPHDHFWGYVLFEMESWKNKEYRAYLGGRVLIQRLTSEPTGNWYGVLKSLSPYAPTLKIGNYIKGKPWGMYQICVDLIENEKPVTIPRPSQIPKTNSFGLFVSPRGNAAELLCANIPCSNPSCHHVHSTMTYRKFREIICREQLDEDAYDDVTLQPTLRLECPVCDTLRIIDESFFEGLYKEE